MINKLENHNLNCNIFSAYDYNGLTMQELLCQFFTRINECVDLSNESFTIMEWIKTIGLSEEVGKLLLQWYEDGTLGDIINENLFTTIEFYPILPHEVGVVSEKYHYGDVRRFGAKGDGETDNTTPFNNCMKSLGSVWSNVSNTMYIPCGNWKYTQPIIIDRDNMTLKGDGIEQTILSPQGCDGVKCTGTQMYGVIIKDFAINGGLTGLDASNITLNCRVTNISIQGCEGVGYYCKDGFDHLVEYVVVRGCKKLGIFIDQTENTDSTKFKEMSYITFNNCISVANNSGGTQWKISGNNMYLNNCKANECNLGVEFIGEVWSCRVTNFYMDGTGKDSVMFKVNSEGARNITFEKCYGWNFGYMIQATQGKSIFGRNLDNNPGDWDFTALRVDNGYNGIVDLDGKNYKIEDNRELKHPFLYFDGFIETPGQKIWCKEIDIQMYAGGTSFAWEYTGLEGLNIQQIHATPINDITYIARDIISDAKLTPLIKCSTNYGGYGRVEINAPCVCKTTVDAKLQVMFILKPSKAYT